VFHIYVKGKMIAGIITDSVLNPFSPFSKPDPVILVNVDPDPAFQTNVDPDLGETLLNFNQRKIKRFQFL
jgi:hypothetical protein